MYLSRQACTSSKDVFSLSPDNTPQKTSHQQSSTKRLTRDELWNVRDQLIRCNNSVASDIGHQLAQLYFLIDQSETNDTTFNARALELWGKIWIAHENKSISSKEYEIAIQDLNEQNKLFELFTNIPSLNLEAKDMIEKALSESDPEMVGIMVMRYLESDLVDQVLKVLKSTHTQLGENFALYLHIILPKKILYFGLNDLYNYLNSLMENTTKEQLNKLEEIFTYLSKFLKSTDVNKMIWDFIQHRDVNPMFNFVHIGKDILDTEKNERPHLITKNRNTFLLIG